MTHREHCNKDKDETVQNSMDEAGGVAVGLTGQIYGYNADVEARFAKALLSVGEWVHKEAGVLLGHIKAVVYHEDGTGITFSLTNFEEGVVRNGTLEPCEKINFNFMVAVLDVDAHDVKHEMMHALEDTGIDYDLEGHEHKHSHSNGNCHCKSCEDVKEKTHECQCKHYENKKDDSNKKSFLDRLKRK